ARRDRGAARGRAAAPRGAIAARSPRTRAARKKNHHRPPDSARLLGALACPLLRHSFRSMARLLRRWVDKPTTQTWESIMSLSRRRLLAGTAAIPSAAVIGRAKPAAAQAREITVGFIYVGPRDDFGWNQAHAVGAQALRGARNVKLVEQENVPETIA